MGAPPPPPPPAAPGIGHGHQAPELIQTNRQILEQMRELREEHQATQRLALHLEGERAVRKAPSALEKRERHESTMNIFRQALNPQAEAIDAMQRGAASLHRAAEIS